MARVAQLAEHRTVDAAVAGSSPVSRPYLTGFPAGFFYWGFGASILIDLIEEVPPC